MSYDVWLTVDTGGPEPSMVGFDLNYTSNCARMWRKAMPDTDGLDGLDGKAAGDVAAAIRAGIAAMEQDPDAYKALNPPNGWGDYDGQLKFLRLIASGCEAAPLAKVRVAQ